MEPDITLVDLATLGRADNGREGKVLMLRWRRREYWLVSVPDDHRYHNQMLARFCTDNAIAHHWASETELVVEDSDLETLGGGRYRIEGERLVLWDDSQAYGRFPENGLAGKPAGAMPPWSRFSLDIR